MNSHNGELLGAYGNFVNRCLAFIGKYFGGYVPEGRENEEINGRIESLFVSVGKQIENGAFKDAIDEIFEFVRSANKFFDAEKPWVTRNTDIAACKNTLYQCVQIIANLAVLLSPFLPFSSEKVCKWLGIPSSQGSGRQTHFCANSVRGRLPGDKESSRFAGPSLPQIWKKQSVPAGVRIPEAEILFCRIDKKVIETETEKLNKLLIGISSLHGVRY